jgi:hypothetical protein
MDEDDAFWSLEDIEQLHSTLASTPDRQQQHVGDLPSPLGHHHDYLTSSSATANVPIVAADIQHLKGPHAPKRTGDTTVNTHRELVAWLDIKE